MSIDEMKRREIKGATLSPGRAEGRLFVTKGAVRPCLRPRRRRDTDHEKALFSEQSARLLEDLRKRAEKLDAQSLSSEADIFRGHAAILQDPALHKKVEEAVERSDMIAEEAVESVLEELAQAFESSDNMLIRERAADFRDLAQQLRHRLTMLPTDERSCLDGAEAAVIVVDELMPSLVLGAWERGARAFLVSQGTPISHAAIIAQSLGLPVVRVASIELFKGEEGRLALVDGDGGAIVLSPSEEEEAATASLEEDRSWRTQTLPAKLWLSIMTPGQLGGQDWQNIEGVGLYRTEMLYLKRADRFPTEDEQFAAYRELFELCGDRPAVVRTADLGADKRVRYMHFGPETNPYLGLRAHRLFRFHPEIMITQARAIFRAAAGRCRLRLLFPMLETIDQWDFVHSLLQKAIHSLKDEGADVPESFETGILVETPAAVWSFPQLIARADFASVGTNDLVQYVFAAERDAPNVAPYYLPEHPVMLQILRQLVEQAKQVGKELSICGEIASEASYLPLLIGLGFEHLTVAASHVDAIGTALTRLDPEGCRRLAEECAALETAAQVREKLGLTPIPSEPTGDAVPAAMESNHAVDPVCGMIIARQGSTPSLAVDGVVYYFCSDYCRNKFQQRGNR